MKKELFIFLFIFIICFLISKFIFSFGFVHGISMEPNFNDKQLIFINKLHNNYNFNDVIIFRKNNIKLIKRIIALPGDKIYIKEKCLFINDTFYGNINIDLFYFGKNEYKLKDNEYFVLGDNLLNSIDSRYEEVGLIFEDEIIGKIIY